MQSVGATVGIATFDGVAERGRCGAAAGLGLEVQPMKHLPLAIVKGSVAAMRPRSRRRRHRRLPGRAHPAARHRFVQRDRRRQDSRRRLHRQGRHRRRRRLRVRRHPRRPRRPRRPQREAGRRRVPQQPPDPSKPGDGTFVVPIEQSPYNNTDLGSGHGTHVSGIIAADGTTGPDHLGVAPDAEPDLLLDRRSAVHHGRHLGVRPHARSAQPVGHRRRQQLVGQLVPCSTTPRIP